MSVRNAVCCVVSMAVQNAVCCVVSLAVQNAVCCVVSMAVQNAVCRVVSLAVQNAVCRVVSLAVQNAVCRVVSLAVRLCAVLYHWRSGCVLCCIIQSGTLCAVLYHWRSGMLWPSGTLGLALPSGQAGSHSLEMFFCCRCCCCCCFPFHYPAREFLTAARTYFRNLTICPTLGCHLGNCHCCFCCPGSLLSSV